MPTRISRRSGRRGSLCGEPVRRRAGGAWGVRVRWPQHRRRAAGGGGGGGPAAISRISRARAWASCGWWTRAAPTCAQQQPCACKGPSPSPPPPHLQNRVIADRLPARTASIRVRLRGGCCMGAARTKGLLARPPARRRPPASPPVPRPENIRQS